MSGASLPPALRRRDDAEAIRKDLVHAHQDPRSPESEQLWLRLVWRARRN